MIQKAVQFLKYWFGDFNKEELKKYLFLGVIFSLMIGTYWTLRPMKDSFFGSLVVGYGGKEGREVFLALAKVVSLIMLVPIVTLYGTLVERFKKNVFFYGLTGLYAVLMIAWSLFFLSPTYGLANEVASTWRVSGWLWYVFVESFGSLVIALFWAIVIDISSTESAKRGFALIVMVGQLGGIIFPKYLALIPRTYGVSPAIVVGICGIITFAFLVLFWLFVKSTPKELFVGYSAKKEYTEHKEEPGLMEGLSLLLKHKYLLGIFAILSFFEFIATVIDFNFKSLVFKQFADVTSATEYLGSYGSSVNLVAFLCLLFGINNIQRWLGLTTALCLVPVIVGCAVAAFYVFPQLDVLFVLIVGAKAINYALNGPTIKQLYIPTSEDVKFKSQAWIETFGSRLAKASSSFVNLTKGALGAQLYLAMTVCMCLGLSAVWFFIALYLAGQCNKALKHNEIIC